MRWLSVICVEDGPLGFFFVWVGTHAVVNDNDDVDNDISAGKYIHPSIQSCIVNIWYRYPLERYRSRRARSKPETVIQRERYAQRDTYDANTIQPILAA